MTRTKYSHGTFLIYAPDQLHNLKSFDDVFELLMKNNATDGVPEIHKLAQLSTLLTGSIENIFSPVDHRISDTSVFFLVARVFTDAMAEGNDDQLGKLSSGWANSESWKDTDVNPFDLFGLLHYLNLLCRKARSEDKELYFLLSGESDMLPP